MKKMLAIYSNGVSSCISFIASEGELKGIIDKLKKNKITTDIEIYMIEDMYKIKLLKGYDVSKAETITIKTRGGKFYVRKKN